MRQVGLDCHAAFVEGRRRVGCLEPATRAFKRLRKLTRRETPAPQDDADSDARLLLQVPGGLIAKYRSWLDVTAAAGAIDVAFTSPSPTLSQQVANAHAAQYVRPRLRVRPQITGEPATFLDGELDRVRA